MKKQQKLQQNKQALGSALCASTGPKMIVDDAQTCNLANQAAIVDHVIQHCPICEREDSAAGDSSNTAYSRSTSKQTTPTSHACMDKYKARMIKERWPGIYLHAWRYIGPDWSYETQLPSWFLHV